MKNVLILHAFDPLRPTGISRLVRRLCSELEKRSCRVTLAMPAMAERFSESKAEWESLAGGSQNVSLLWWESSQFTPPQREQLVQNLEQLHSRSAFDHVLAVGITQCGFAAAIACRILDIPYSVFVTYRDALCYHSLQPHELEVSVEHAFRAVTTNPHVLNHIKAFHQVEDRLLLIDPRPDRKALQVEANFENAERTEEEPYLLTTGHIDQFMQLRDLVDRVRSLASEQGLDTWRHVGMLCPATKTRLEGLLATAKSPVLVHDVEIVPRRRYVELVSNAAVHVIPQGETDTNAAAYESEIWGVPTNYPDMHCFPSTRERKRTVHFGKNVEDLTRLDQLAEDLSR